MVALRRHLRTASRVAVLIESGDPALKNLVITAEELLRHPDRSAGVDRAPRLRRCGRAAERRRSRSGRPDRARGHCRRGGGAACGADAGGRAHDSTAGPNGSCRWWPATPARGPSAIEVRARAALPIRGGPPAVLTNPARIDALEGTRLTLVVTNPPGAVQRALRRATASGRSAIGRVAIDLALVESGYFAIELGSDDRS